MKSECLSDQDVDEAAKLMNLIPAQMDELIGLLDRIELKIDSNELNFSNGLSILDLKNLNMLNYLQNLAFVMLKKANGELICGDPAIKRLVELRVMMEKMRPIEEKLKYEVNKLLSSVSNENIDSNDPLRFRAQPDEFDVAEDNDDQNEGEEKKEKVYVPPKITPAFYDEDNLLERRKKALENAKRKALSSTIMEELRSEFDTGPEEIKEMRDPHKLKISQELKERERFEEEYMMRLPMTKRQKHEMRQLTTVSNFNSKFEDLSAIEATPSMHRRKSSSKKGKPKYRGKKRSSKKK